VGGSRPDPPWLGPLTLTLPPRRTKKPVSAAYISGGMRAPGCLAPERRGMGDPRVRHAQGRQAGPFLRPTPSGPGVNPSFQSQESETKNLESLLVSIGDSNSRSFFFDGSVDSSFVGSRSSSRALVPRALPTGPGRAMGRGRAKARGKGPVLRHGPRRTRLTPWRTPRIVGCACLEAKDAFRCICATHIRCLCDEFLLRHHFLIFFVGFFSE